MAGVEQNLPQHAGPSVARGSHAGRNVGRMEPVQRQVPSHPTTDAGRRQPNWKGNWGMAREDD